MSRRLCPGGGRRRQSLRRGAFTSAGGVAANHIAKWNGSTWSALGSGMERQCLCPGGRRRRQRLCRGALHHRRRRGGEPHRQVERQRLVRAGQRDGGTTIGVSALAVDADGDVYVGGRFTTAGEAVRTISPSGTAAPGRPGQRDATASIECGTACSADFAAGTTVTLMASPGAFSTFTGWSGACTGGGPCLLTMDANKAVTGHVHAADLPAHREQGGFRQRHGGKQSCRYRLRRGVQCRFHYRHGGDTHRHARFRRIFLGLERRMFGQWVLRRHDGCSQGGDGHLRCAPAQ